MRGDKRFSTLLVSSFLAVLLVLTIFAVTWGVRYDWPDNVHVDHGVPLVWATHTLSTIAGPVDIWEVDLSALVMDLLFWLGLTVVAMFVMLRLSAR